MLNIDLENVDLMQLLHDEFNAAPSSRVESRIFTKSGAIYTISMNKYDTEYRRHGEAAGGLADHPKGTCVGADIINGHLVLELPDGKSITSTRVVLVEMPVSC